MQNAKCKSTANEGRRLPLAPDRAAGYRLTECIASEFLNPDP
jgi:hypothetical protein